MPIDDSWQQRIREQSSQKQDRALQLRLDRMRNVLHDLNDEPSLEVIPKVVEQLSRFASNERAAINPPPLVSHFVAGFLKGRASKGVLDPNAGMGSLLATAQAATNAKRAVAFERSTEAFEIGKLLNPSAEWHRGPLRAGLVEQENFDVVVSVLPFGEKRAIPRPVRERPSYNGPPHRETGFYTLLESSRLLTEAGVGIYVTTPNFFWSSDSPFHRLHEDGIGVTAALALPAGVFAPVTSISTYLVITSRDTNGKMFVGKLTNNLDANESLLDNLSGGTSGTSIEDGVLVDAKAFVSVEAVASSAKVKEAARLFGAPAVYLFEMMTGSTMGRAGENLEFPGDSNAIYIPTVGSGTVVTSTDDFKIKPQNYLQVRIDPSKSDAKFIARFLNSEIGRFILDAGMSGSTIRLFTPSALKTLQVLVPTIEHQKHMLEIETHIASEQNVLAELQGQLSSFQQTLWSNPNEAYKSVLQNLPGPRLMAMHGKRNRRQDGPSRQGW